jgi:hypothetical protein
MATLHGWKLTKPCDAKNLIQHFLKIKMLEKCSSGFLQSELVETLFIEIILSEIRISCLKTVYTPEDFERYNPVRRTIIINRTPF